MRKGTKNLIIAAVAVFAAALLACLIVLAALPAGTGARYAEDEMYSGVVANNGNLSHTHSGWTEITGSMTITVATSATGNYYLTEDVTGDITIEAPGTSSSNAPVVNICLNGHALTGTGSGSVITIGNPSSSGYVTVNLYDCGGESTWNQHCYRYLYEDDDAVVDGEPFPTRYDFSDEDIDPDNPETYDGCVRGGLITGGNATSQYYGGGVTVGYRATLNMYGGTIAGNKSSGMYAAGGVSTYRGTINLYGGTFEGNSGYNSSSLAYTAGGIYVYGSGYLYMYGGEIKNNHNAGVSARSANSGSCYFYMYGGLISGNYCGNDGGGIHVQGFSGSLARIYVYGGNICGNYAKGNGGGILFDSYAYMYLYGGTVTGNRAEGEGGGVCYSGGTNYFYIQGTPYVCGNYAAGKISNLELYFDLSDQNDTYLRVDGNLTEGARVGISTFSISGTFIYQITSSASKSNYSTDVEVLQASARYFLPDDSNYGIELYEGTSDHYLRFYKKSA